MSEDLPENCNHGGRLDTEGESTTLFRVREERNSDRGDNTIQSEEGTEREENWHVVLVN